uniref:Rhodanese domain-containing protein n=1 Tax=Pyramimonas obovata TaxID=1411642 RepID=A0A7S0RJQ9_9CHLO|mmetsp:Transcript_35784/g.78120  ORF Transcript_35784/g.78120 Transcript_35784/m.78120 type:complete len:253 (+) Transcript_35784:72-830(+)|eukprot:CAMPEP_0118932950 /NCGR_PEP_ID=MMETSP1169-20130426/10775_1 /TAXON_ID=36882 /ORGANISM="Pyramimonas obovata, Strain CCMP722" /LENGTH=252 /DNA_ID=CAMNT_0006875659 /DNA_START=72 /DNA_END=830 /DNA_ORIENTATION=+
MASIAVSSVGPSVRVSVAKASSSKCATRPCAIRSSQSSFLSAGKASLTVRKTRTCVSRSSKHVTRMEALHYWDGPGGMQFFLRDEKNILTDATIFPEDVLPEMEKGLIVLDVREPQDFEDYRIESALNVPLYVALQVTDVKSLFKRAVYFTNGMVGSQLNADFMKQVQEAIPDKDARIGVICGSGGTVEASSTAGLEGKKSRSLITMYRLIKEGGYTNVNHIDGGMRGWCAKGLPNVGEDTEAWVKKASAMP